MFEVNEKNNVALDSEHYDGKLSRMSTVQPIARRVIRRVISKRGCICSRFVTRSIGWT